MARTSKLEIPVKVAKIEELKKNMPVMEACKKAGLSYITYLKHRGGSGKGAGKNVQRLFNELVAAIRAEVLAEVRRKI